MKKKYEAPQAEKMTFAYEESVIASKVKCQSGVHKVYVDGEEIKPVCDQTFQGTELEWHGEVG